MRMSLTMSKCWTWITMKRMKRSQPTTGKHLMRHTKAKWEHKLEVCCGTHAHQHQHSHESIMEFGTGWGRQCPQ
ncbi:hypothetical protein BDQ17DRAFT_771101 [Cyathus striatus]|nr:hypothetical protein BDQ17DRAFT_771101 [Cyathus striatus]